MYKLSKPVFIGKITNIPNDSEMELEHPLEHLYIDVLKYNMAIAITDIREDGTYVIEARIHHINEKNWANRYVLAPRGHTND